MRTKKKALGVLLFCIAVLLACILWAGGTPPVSVSAETSYGGYHIENFDIEMNIHTDRRIEVTNNVSVRFNQGRHGIIFDLPLEGGVRYTNIKVLRDGEDVKHYGTMAESETDGTTTYVTYNDFLSVYIGDSNVALDSKRTYVYTVSYVMTVPALKEEGYLPVDVLGYGWNNVRRVHAKITFPDGLRQLYFYSGTEYTGSDELGIEKNTVRTGNVLEFSADWSERDGRTYNGITLDFSFEEGVLTVAPDLVPLWIALVGVGLLLLAVVVKLLICREPVLVREINLSAPDEMDPLLMGKLIDNKVDGEDFGALVFYLASKDYLTIDLSKDDDNPTLIRTEKELGDDLPEHCKIFYNGLFTGKKKNVTVSSLRCSFYRTADEVKQEVKTQAGSFYIKRGVVATVLYGLLAVLLTGGFVWLYTLMNVVKGYNDYFPVFASVPAFVCSAICSHISAQRRYKWKKFKLALPVLGGMAGGMLIGMILCLFPNALFGFGTKMLALLFAALAGVMSGLFLCRNKEYGEKLGKILGFKQFIQTTERDKVEFMLKENPDMYYKVLPYAQVLGVTDAWTEKFEGLDMQPPSYVYYGRRDAVFTVAMWHSMSRSMCGSMGRSMTSRPSSGPSSHSGGHGFGGGSGGGFGGGGFGGGGGRSF